MEKKEEGMEKDGDFMVSHLEKHECWKRWRNADKKLENGSCAVITRRKEGQRPATNETLHY